MGTRKTLEKASAATREAAKVQDVLRKGEQEDKLASAKAQGQAQFDSILEMVEALRAAREADSVSHTVSDRRGVDTMLEDAEQAIHEDALSVEVRSAWVPAGVLGGGRGMYGQDKPAEYCILLCTGGPAVRIVGELSEHCEPTSARLEVQDWFQPWIEFRPVADKAEHAKDKFSGYDSEPILLDYACCFWFGE